MKQITLTVVAISFAAYAIAFANGGIGAILFFLPFTMIPFAVTAIFAWQWRTVAGQLVLLVTALAYAAWFGFVYVDVTHWHPDPQGPIAFLFVGIYAAPILALLWLSGFGLELWQRRA